MKPTLTSVWLLSLWAIQAGGAPAEIQSVVLKERVFLVNGQPFFPIMAWLQDPKNFPALKDCGMNTTAGYHQGAGGTRDVVEYLGAIQQAGLYAVLPYNDRLKHQSALLGYIHDDEPDLSRQVSEARVEPGPGLRLNPKTPLWKLQDGDLSSWSVLDPLEGGAVTLKLAQPVTVTALGLAVTVSKGLAMPGEVVFETGGKELLKTRIEAKKGRQKFALAPPATFQELTLRISSVIPGDQAWGSLGEIEAWDAQGQNVLLSPPRQEPRAWPPKTQEHFAAVKKADPTRPLFMTLTGNFLPFFKKWPEEQRARLYPEYLKAADVVGYDIYPIYGWNKPEWLHLGHDATQLLVDLAGQRPVYAWIETSKGGQWTGPLENQKDVTGDHIRAEVWMCLCRGATAIGYFTHVWKPAYHQFGVPLENRRALRQINEQITRLTPALLGPPARQLSSIASPENVKLDLLARQGPDGLYIFAVNFDEKLKTAQATLRVAGLAAGTAVTVVDENRTVAASDGFFRDTFAPLAVHIYKIGTPPKP